MTHARKSIVHLLLAAGIVVSLAACMPQPPADDNDNISFVRQIVPKLLGRKPKGVEEVEVLADIAQLQGREAVVRLLMEQPEFVSHWTDVLVDDLALQREGFRAQSTACFGDPLRAAPTAALANFVTGNPATASAPGGAFNMIDVIQSAIVADDLSAIYRAYPVPLTNNPGLDNDFQRPTSVGDAFNHVFLNHQLACLQCHNSDFSTTNGVGWDRTFALPLQLETAVYGASFSDPATTTDAMYGLFRGDQRFGATAIAPWGMASSCGMMRTSLAGLSDVATSFAGASGNQVGLVDLAGIFKSGTDALKSTGLSRTPVSGANPTVPSDQGYGYMVAMTISQNVWEELLGEKLTIANYYPRNLDQRNALWNITEFSFISGDWSLKDLIVRITNQTRFFNRRAPDTGSGVTAYVMQMILDPWVAHDPRIPDPMPDPKDYHNGQGELVHRYSPRNLLHSIAAALGWPEPKRFPDGSYPSMTLEKSIGQFISDEQQGTKGVDFQGLLNWEAQFGVCAKPAGVGTDWVDHLTAAIPAFDAANPGSPATLTDVAETMKDWLVGDAGIVALAPVPVDPMTPIQSEQAALAALYGATLNTTASTVPDLGTKLRKLCGVLLESPRFMLAGIETSTGLDVPRLRVCNGAPCTYQELCQVYSATLGSMGQNINCGNHVVSAGSPMLRLAGNLQKICPHGDCFILSSKAVLLCERRPELCALPALPVEFPPVPECGPVSCPAPWFDIRKPVMFVAKADGASVLTAKGVTILSAGGRDFGPVKEGTALKAGDILRIPPGAVFEARSNAGSFSTPDEGMVSKTIDVQSPIDREFLEAVENGKLATVDALLAKGASINSRDKYGRTALMKSADAGNLPLMTMLLQRGADASAEDSQGLNAADLATVGKRQFANDLLAKRGIFAKAPDVLAKAPPRQEAPWLFLVVGSTPKPASTANSMTPAEAWALADKGAIGTHAKDIGEIQALWKKTNFKYRGEGGVLPDPKAAQEAVQRYMKEGFAREHPKVRLPDTEKMAP